MIPMQLTTALAVYSFLLALCALVIWVYTETASQRYRRELGKQNLWKCVFCGYTYLDESGGRMSNCPRCESINALEDGHPAAAARPVVQESATPEIGVGEEAQRNTSKRKRPNQRRRGPRRRR